MIVTFFPASPSAANCFSVASLSLARPMMVLFWFAASSLTKAYCHIFSI
jgi:hypothetical protein